MIKKIYLLHGEVIPNNRTTSKIGIILDALSHGLNDSLLNYGFHVGPNLYPDI